AEKDGSFTNTQRLVQWHDQAVLPPGDARSESWFLFHLGRRLEELYREDRGDSPARRQILSLTWDYPLRGPLGDPDAESVMHEINGYSGADRRQVPDWNALKDDGSTAWVAPH